MIGERALEAVIARTIEQVVLVHLHPRTAINVTIQEMQSDGLVSFFSILVENVSYMNKQPPWYLQEKTLFSTIKYAPDKRVILIFLYVLVRLSQQV